MEYRTSKYWAYTKIKAKAMEFMRPTDEHCTLTNLWAVELPNGDSRVICEWLRGLAILSMSLAFSSAEFAIRCCPHLLTIPRDPEQSSQGMTGSGAAGSFSPHTRQNPTPLSNSSSCSSSVSRTFSISPRRFRFLSNIFFVFSSIFGHSNSSHRFLFSLTSFFSLSVISDQGTKFGRVPLGEETRKESLSYSWSRISSNPTPLRQSSTISR